MNSVSVISSCPICHSRKIYYAFNVPTTRVVRCAECDFIYLSPQPSEDVLKNIYNSTYFCGASDDNMRDHVATLKTATAETYLDFMEKHSESCCGQLLEVGCGDGYLLKAAERRGFEVTGVEYSEHAAKRAGQGLLRGRVIIGEIEQAPIAEETFDACVLADVIEHVRDPRAFLESIWKKLKPGGRILIATPSLDSLSARVMGTRWLEFKTEHLFYFDRRSLESLLWQTGFQAIEVAPGRKYVSPQYVAAHFERYHIPILTKLALLVSKLMPAQWRKAQLYIAGSGMLVIASKKERSSVLPLVSIIIPAYNERATIKSILEAVSAKQLPGMEKEIIVVESNSSDGTREIVEAYINQPNFKIIFEEKARGKGAATRVGIAAAKGDIILIQDADLEYDLEDYEALLEPILSGRESFVLGARHGGRKWKMRHFNNQPLQALLLNLAHLGFTLLINASLGIWLKDPFTMYKVFRRDCLHGLTFTCNRFDFDWELLIKLVRKGYRPIEIPVNYRSRSFKEGKKIRMFRDPLTWIWAWAKARFGPLN